MNYKRIHIALFVILFVTQFFASASDGELTRRVFPQKPDAPLFKYGVDMEIINQYIYIVNNRKSFILSYQIGDTVEFKRQIGRFGQGPGDCHLPIEVSQWNNILALKDQYGFSFFTEDGRFLSKFRVFSPWISFVYVNDKIYYATSKPKSRYMIICFEKDGKKVAEFGEKYLDIDFKKSIGQSPYHVETLLYEGKLLSDGKKIYYFNAKFGDVRVFELDGKLIDKKNITEIFGETGRTIVADNTEMLKNGIKERPNGTIPDYTLFKDICLCKDKIYLIDKIISGKFISDKTEKVDIMALDKDTLKLVKKYWLTLYPEEYIHSFAVIEKEGQPIFYITMTTAEVGGTDITEFKEKKK
jgi:hypothetical protein